MGEPVEQLRDEATFFGEPARALGLLPHRQVRGGSGESCRRGVQCGSPTRLQAVEAVAAWHISSVRDGPRGAIRNGPDRAAGKYCLFC